MPQPASCTDGTSQCGAWREAARGGLLPPCLGLDVTLAAASFGPRTAVRRARRPSDGAGQSHCHRR
ncbi:MAG TPA: hypothetical protein PKW66_13135, partial [Polyangiaceae bacterium]|nr:hypothetical protein [Polyangiaceae bacterium]